MFAWRCLPRKVMWPEVHFRKASAMRRSQWGRREGRSGKARQGDRIKQAVLVTQWRNDGDTIGSGFERE